MVADRSYFPVSFGVHVVMMSLIAGHIDAANVRGTLGTRSVAEPSHVQVPTAKERTDQRANDTVTQDSVAFTLARRPRSGKNRLPSQGFEGVPVRHSSGETYADDWGNEYPTESDETEHIRYSESWKLGEQQSSSKEVSPDSNGN
eukprot:TRINITY_DN3049_c0_g2_i1.p1 TRINITY_DN3049_c0_g2~~TRINITY_DN3049_c0_g2_i1.p1  ORF type:complete len:145 (-),score=19.85 TRINITY_DN3049_c0_g2_i1:166-600(-)